MNDSSFLKPKLFQEGFQKAWFLRSCSFAADETIAEACAELGSDVMLDLDLIRRELLGDIRLESTVAHG